MDARGLNSAQRTRFARRPARRLRERVGKYETFVSRWKAELRNVSVVVPARTAALLFRDFLDDSERVFLAMLPDRREQGIQ